MTHFTLYVVISFVVNIKKILINKALKVLLFVYVTLLYLFKKMVAVVLQNVLFNLPSSECVVAFSPVDSLSVIC